MTSVPEFPNQGPTWPVKLYCSGAAKKTIWNNGPSKNKIMIWGGISYVAFGIEFTFRQIDFLPR
jgi:hypothetical protein